jgi:hypothetical protein
MPRPLEDLIVADPAKRKRDLPKVERAFEFSRLEEEWLAAAYTAVVPPNFRPLPRSRAEVFQLNPDPCQPTTRRQAEGG